MVSELQSERGSSACEGMENVAVAYTPLHIIYIKTILDASRKGPWTLFVVEESPGTAAFAKGLLENSNVCIRALRGTARLRSTVERWRGRFVVAANAIAMRKALSGSEPKRVLVTNDFRIESQIMLAMSEGSAVSVEYYEEGLSLYSQKRMSKGGIYRKKLLGGLLGIQGIHSVGVQAEDPRIDVGRATYPELLDGRGESGSRIEWQTIRVGSDIKRKLCNIAKQKMSGRDVNIAEIDGLVLPPPSWGGRGPAAMRKRTVQAVRQVRDDENTVLVKYHPREEASDYLGLASEDWCELVVTRTLPVEVYLAAIHGNLSWLLVGASSAAITAEQFAPDATLHILSEWYGSEKLPRVLLERMGAREA